MIAARQIAFGKTAGAAKPYKARLEYLESTGTQYINTGVVVNTLTAPTLDADIYVTSVSSNHYVIGADPDDGTTNARFSVGVLTRLRLEVRVGNYSNFNISEGWHNVRLNGATGECYVDGSIVYTSGYYGNLANNTFPIILFGVRGNRLAGVRLSGVKISDGSTPIRSFIPFLDNALVPCMYDEVTGAFFYNQGEGEFIAGPVVDDVDYTARDYVQDGLLTNS